MASVTCVLGLRLKSFYTTCSDLSTPNSLCNKHMTATIDRWHGRLNVVEKMVYLSLQGSCLCPVTLPQRWKPRRGFLGSCHLQILKIRVKTFSRQYRRLGCLEEKSLSRMRIKRSFDAHGDKSVAGITAGYSRSRHSGEASHAGQDERRKELEDHRGVQGLGKRMMHTE